MRWFLFIVFFTFIKGTSFAQFTSGTVGIDGLTCSMCSNSVERLLNKLDFIDSIQMDLNNTVAHLYFTPGKKIDFNSISRKVMDAGFSVRNIKAIYHFKGVQAIANSYFIENDTRFIFINTNGQILEGLQEVLFLDKKLINKDEYLQWERYLKEDSKINKPDKNTYHITR